MPSSRIDRAIAALEAPDLEASLRDFILPAWNAVFPAIEYQHNWHIDAIADHLQAVDGGDLRKLVINIPPRCCKSTLCSVLYPAWSWTRNQAKRFMFASYADSVTRRDSRFCRELLRCQWYRDRWGHKVKIKPDQDCQLRYETTSQGMRLAVTVGGTNAGEGGDVIVIDDPHNFMEVYSQAHRQKAINWWTTAMSTRSNDPRAGARVVIMQRVHQEDLCSILRDEGDWTWLVLPMDYEPKVQIDSPLGFKDPREEKGTLLWPDRFGQPEVDAISKSLGSYDAAAQLQQDPVPRGGSIIKDSWLQYYDELPDGVTEYVTTWDCAFKGFSTSSYVAGGVWARKGADFYLVDQVREHLDFVQTLTAIERMAKRYPQCQKKLVEDKANGPAVIRMLKNKVPGIIAWPRKGKALPPKESRLYAVSPLFEAGNVWIPRNRSWTADYVTEMTTFPQSPDNDQVDQTTMALLEYTQGPRILLESDCIDEAH
jgi:predicted phage terminase large subunit-like protein